MHTLILHTLKRYLEIFSIYMAQECINDIVKWQFFRRQATIKRIARTFLRSKELIIPS